jgi:hypothetical protein
MLKNLCVYAVLLSFSFPMAVQARNCKFGSPAYDMHISKLQYNDEFYPYLTLSNGVEYSLLYTQGLDKTYGRAMLAVALTAMTMNAVVDVCLSGNDISSITIKQ